MVCGSLDPGLASPPGKPEQPGCLCSSGGGAWGLDDSGLVQSPLEGEPSSSSRMRCRLYPVQLLGSLSPRRAALCTPTKASLFLGQAWPPRVSPAARRFLLPEGKPGGRGKVPGPLTALRGNNRVWAFPSFLAGTCGDTMWRARMNLTFPFCTTGEYVCVLG